MSDARTAERAISFGLVSSVLLAFACLFGGSLYLWRYLSVTNTGIQGVVNALKVAGNANLSEELVRQGIYAQMDASRVTLLSCAMFIGMALCFLGFGLFLMGVRGEIEAALKGLQNASVTLSRLSPGALVILAGALLVGLCATNRPVFSYSQLGDTKPVDLQSLTNAIRQSQTLGSGGRTQGIAAQAHGGGQP